MNRQFFRLEFIVLEKLQMRNVIYLNYYLFLKFYFGEKKYGGFVVKSLGFGVRNVEIKILVLLFVSQVILDKLFYLFNSQFFYL